MPQIKLIIKEGGNLTFDVDGYEENPNECENVKVRSQNKLVNTSELEILKTSHRTFHGQMSRHVGGKLVTLESKLFMTFKKLGHEVDLNTHRSF